MTIDDFGGRKFIFAIFVILCAFLFVISGQIDFDQFMSTIIWAFGIFSVSNAVSHLSDGGSMTVDHKILKENIKNISEN